MTVSLKHAFESEVADGDDDTLIRPSNWNAEHVITMATARLLGRTTADVGAVEELTASDARTFLNVEDGADVTDAANVATAGAFMKASDDSDDITEGSTKLLMTTGERTKVGHLTVTQAVDLDAMESKLANVEENADVTDATNVASAGAFMKSGDDSDDISEGSTNLFLTSAERTRLGQLETGDSPQFAGIELGHATENTLTAASGVLSIEGTPIKKAGRETLVIPAAAWCPTITNGAGRSYTELATNDLISETVDFDTTTQEFATYEWYPPKAWNAGTITFRVRWRVTGGSSTQTLDMALSAVAISDDDAEDAAPGTPVAVTDTWIANGDQHISPESTAVTIAGTPAKADKVFLKLQRNVSTDNLSGDALIEAVEVFYTTDAATDA